jgi:hypothetical protein
VLRILFYLEAFSAPGLNGLARAHVDWSVSGTRLVHGGACRSLPPCANAAPVPLKHAPDQTEQAMWMRTRGECRLGSSQPTRMHLPVSEGVRVRVVVRWCAGTSQDSEATPNDKFVALELLKNANVAAGRILPGCQDTGTAIIMGKKGQQVWRHGPGGWTSALVKRPRRSVRDGIRVGYAAHRLGRCGPDSTTRRHCHGACTTRTPGPTCGTRKWRRRPCTQRATRAPIYPRRCVLLCHRGAHRAVATECASSSFLHCLCSATR